MFLPRDPSVQILEHPGDFQEHQIASVILFVKNKCCTLISSHINDIPTLNSSYFLLNPRETKIINGFIVFSDCNFFRGIAETK